MYKFLSFFILGILAFIMLFNSFSIQFVLFCYFRSTKLHVLGYLCCLSSILSIAFSQMEMFFILNTVMLSQMYIYLCVYFIYFIYVQFSVPQLYLNKIFKNLPDAVICLRDKIKILRSGEVTG